MFGKKIRGCRSPFIYLVCKRNAIRAYSSSHDRFMPRAKFPVPPSNSFTWFPGHMLAGLRALAEKVHDTDLVIETRDARIPLSSRNPFLEDVCANRRRLVLYNKRDLAGLTSVQEDVTTIEKERADGRE